MSWGMKSTKLTHLFTKRCPQNRYTWSKLNSSVRNYGRVVTAPNSDSEYSSDGPVITTTTPHPSCGSFTEDSNSLEIYSSTQTREPPKASHIYNGICPWRSKEELANFLCANILHESNGVIAINKPFGVGVLNNVKRGEAIRMRTIREGKPDPKKSDTFSGLYHARGLAATDYTLEEVVPLLREQLNLPELQLIKSPEKYASGVAVFGANETIAQKLQVCTKTTKAMKIRASGYLVISTNIPKVVDGYREERVGITLKENEGTRVKQPVIETTFSLRSMYACAVYPAQVQVQVLATNHALGVCCSEIRTDQTRWNFLRVYAAHALMPLLGDHLYSARVQSIMGVKIAIPALSIDPGTANQKLSKEVMAALELRRPEDTLIVPLHVHLQSYTISKYLSKRKELVIKAPPPPFFEWTCNQLGLHPPDD